MHIEFHHIIFSVLKRILFLVLIFIAIPFVTNTLPFMENDSIEISIFLETDIEGESSELNDVDDDFFHELTNVSFASNNYAFNSHFIKPSSFYLYFENTTPPPEKSRFSLFLYLL